MYVCICQGITESELIELAEANGTHEGMTHDAMLETASDTLGVGTGCGRCLEFALESAKDILEQRSVGQAVSQSVI